LSSLFFILKFYYNNRKKFHFSPVYGYIFINNIFIFRRKPMPGQRLKDYLKSHNVQFESIDHPLAYTAQKTAQAAHLHGRNVAKTVLLKIDGKLTMAVMTANQKVNTRLIKTIFSASEVELANEEEFKYLFKDCETGAMPPFGNLYGIDEFVSEELTHDETIAFNAGSHNELIRMKYKDFENLIHPRVINFKIRM